MKRGVRKPYICPVSAQIYDLHTEAIGIRRNAPYFTVRSAWDRSARRQNVHLRWSDDAYLFLGWAEYGYSKANARCYTSKARKVAR